MDAQTSQHSAPNNEVAAPPAKPVRVHSALLEVVFAITVGEQTHLRRVPFLLKAESDPDFNPASVAKAADIIVALQAEIERSLVQPKPASAVARAKRFLSRFRKQA